MEFAAFAARAAAIEAEDADLAVVDAVADLLGAAGDDLPVVSRYVQGRVFPAWRSTTLDVGPRLCYEAIARAAGRNVSADDVEDRLAERGEIGDVAASYDLDGQRGLAAFGEGGGALTVAEVHAELSAIAAAEGDGSQERKLGALFGLFTRCAPDEARYLARLVLGEMRIGVGEGAVRDAVAAAFDVPVDAVERALMVSNDFGHVAETAREAGVDGLAAIRLEVGRPVGSMLAQDGTVADALESWGEAVVEWKYDGARVQLHYDGRSVSAFSRNLEDVTDALPEVVEFVEAHTDGPAILDGEVVAVDADGEPLPFQAVLRRFRRKHDVERAREAVELRPHFFDCLHAAGEDLLNRPLAERQARLDGLLDAGVAERERCADAEAARAVEAAALAAGHEGVMCKDPGSAYRPGRRGRRWLKVKPEVDTLDCAVTGAEWGEGRRATLLGTYELSVRTDDGYAPVGKVATGFSDEDLAALTERLRPHVRAEAGQRVDLEPAVVFEVGYAEIQRSPTYGSGFALRFPRFLGVREDKSPGDADTLERVEALAAGGASPSADGR